jgi:hypothetical protein
MPRGTSAGRAVEGSAFRLARVAPGFAAFCAAPPRLLRGEPRHLPLSIVVARFQTGDFALARVAPGFRK